MYWESVSDEERQRMPSAPESILEPARDLSKIAHALIMERGQTDCNGRRTVHVESKHAAYRIVDVCIQDWQKNKRLLDRGLFIDRLVLNGGSSRDCPSEIQLPRSFSGFKTKQEELEALFHLRGILPQSFGDAVSDLSNCRFISAVDWYGLAGYGKR